MDFNLTATLANSATTPLKFGLIELGWTFVFQIVNTIIMYMILKHLLFKPVTAFMQKRQEGIANQIEEAKQKNLDADNLIAVYNGKIDQAHSEAATIIKDANKAAQDRAHTVMRIANSDAEKLMEKAKHEISREREKAIFELKGEISDMAVLVASKLIDRNIDDKTHTDLVDSAIEQIGGTKWSN